MSFCSFILIAMRHLVCGMAVMVSLHKRLIEENVTIETSHYTQGKYKHPKK